MPLYEVEYESPRFDGRTDKITNKFYADKYVVNSGVVIFFDHSSENGDMPLKMFSTFKLISVSKID